MRRKIFTVLFIILTCCFLTISLSACVGESVTVNFMNEGETFLSVTIEEGNKVSAPETNPERAGYIFDGWDHDFSKPIRNSVSIRAKWIARTDTPYRVEFYFENIEDNEFSLDSSYTEYYTGTTDEYIHYDMPTFENFESFNCSDWREIKGDGSTVIKLYYSRKTFTIDCYGVTSNVGGVFKYGTQINGTAIENLGYDFDGWYSGDELLSDQKNYSFALDKNIVVKGKVKEEMKNFDFDSTPTTCKILGIINGEELEELIIPDYVTSIGEYAFSSCTSVQEIKIPSNMEEIGEYAFAGCTSITEITLPEGVVSVGERAFSWCSSLSTINIPKSIKRLGGYAFDKCWELKTVNYAGSVDEWVDIDFYYLGNPLCNGGDLYINEQQVTNLVVTNATRISAYAFYKCASLQSVQISSTVKSIGNYAFSDCPMLSSVEMSEGVTAIGNYAFSILPLVISIEIPNSVQFVGYEAFRNNVNLTYNEKDGLRYLGNQTNKYFYLDRTLDLAITSATIDENCKIIGSCAFFGCGELRNLEIPNSIICIGDDAFFAANDINYNVKGGLLYLGNATNKYLYLADTMSEDITSATIDSNCKFIGAAFYDCSNLTSIVIPEGVVSIRGLAFSGCSSLSSVKLPLTLKSIGSYAFIDCHSLREIEIPSGVINIGYDAFNGCTQLKIYCETEKENGGWGEQWHGNRPVEWGHEMERPTCEHTYVNQFPCCDSMCVVAGCNNVVKATAEHNFSNKYVCECGAIKPCTLEIIANDFGDSLLAQAQLMAGTMTGDFEVVVLDAQSTVQQISQYIFLNEIDTEKITGGIFVKLDVTYGGQDVLFTIYYNFGLQFSELQSADVGVTYTGSEETWFLEVVEGNKTILFEYSIT